MPTNSELLLTLLYNIKDNSVLLCNGSNY